jgi:hypothetical protein
VLPQFFVDDVTPEALAQVMHEQDGAIGVVSDEAALFGNIGGRYSAGTSNLETVLKGVSGSPIKINRKNPDNPNIHIPHPVLSISVALQPGTWQRLADKPEFRASGMLGRFLPTMPASTLGYRQVDTVDTIPTSVRTAWHTALVSLARTGVELADRDARRVLVVKPDALDLLIKFRVELEPELRPGGRLAAATDFGGKLHGHIVRLAAALTLLADPAADGIDAAVMHDAITLGRAYIGHALTAFGALGGGNPLAPEARLVEWLIKNGQPEVAQRDVHRVWRKRAPEWGKTSDQITEVLRTLETLHYVRREQRKPTTGRPKTVWALNPALLVGQKVGHGD